MNRAQFYDYLKSYRNNSLKHAMGDQVNAMYGEQYEQHKYYRREGEPGKYRYYYSKEEWDAAHAPQKSQSQLDADRRNQEMQRYQNQQKMKTSSQGAADIDKGKKYQDWLNRQKQQKQQLMNSTPKTPIQKAIKDAITNPQKTQSQIEAERKAKEMANYQANKNKPKTEQDYKNEEMRKQDEFKKQQDIKKKAEEYNKKVENEKFDKEDKVKIEAEHKKQMDKINEFYNDARKHDNTEIQENKNKISDRRTDYDGDWNKDYEAAMKELGYDRDDKFKVYSNGDLRYDDNDKINNAITEANKAKQDQKLWKEKYEKASTPEEKRDCLESLNYATERLTKAENDIEYYANQNDIKAQHMHLAIIEKMYKNKNNGQSYKEMKELQKQAEEEANKSIIEKGYEWAKKKLGWK